MNRYFLINIILFSATQYNAQINLIPNGSFEDQSFCPTDISQLNYAYPWFQPFIDSIGHQQSSTDLYSTCSFNSFCKVPDNDKGHQFARTGNSYIGEYYYGNFTEAREFAEVKLIDSLTFGKIYCVKFYVSLAEKSKYAVSNFGAFISKDSCLSMEIIPSNNPQVINPFNNVVSDKNNWQLIEMAYLANGGENFITVGGVLKDSAANVLLVGGIANLSYYFIDDVSVIDISTPAFAGNDTIISPNDSVFIGRTPEIGLNDDCIWFVNGDSIDTIAGMWVKPDSTTTYILEQNICGTITYDSVTVYVYPLGLQPILYNDKNKKLHIYPNPVKNELFIEGKEVINSISIFDIMGRLIISEKSNSKTNRQISVEHLERGVYFMEIEIFEGEKVVRKFVKD